MPNKIDYSIEKAYSGVFYLLYRTVNRINNKEYIGVHKTYNLNDGYIGNGIYSQANANYMSEELSTVFASAVIKYKYENFTRSILGFYESYEEALKQEAIIVNIEFVLQKTNYNVKTGGKNGVNPNNFREYDLTDGDGVRYEGVNIKEFCGERGLNESAINLLVNGKINSSQNFHRTNDYIKPQKYVIVNIETKENYIVENLTKWVRENAPELKNGLSKVLLGTARVALKKWWVCKEEDWTGEHEVRKKANRSKNIFTIIDNQGNLIDVKNVKEFCNEQGIHPSAFYDMMQGKHKGCKNFKAYQVNYVGKRVKKVPKVFRLIDAEGNIHHIVNVKYFCSIHGLDHSSALKVLKGKQKTCRNFKLYTE